MKKLIAIIILTIGMVACGNKESACNYEDGDEFTAKTVEGVDMLFRIISVKDSTVQVGNGQEQEPVIDTLFRGQVTIPSIVNGFKVKRIAEHAFEKCDVSSVIIPEGVTVIKENAFSGCQGLTKVTLPNSLTSIEQNAFWGTKLSSIYIPQFVSFIASRSFPSSPQTIEVDKKNKNYDSREGCNAIIETSSNTLISGCSNSRIPNTVSAIGDWAFDNCIGISEITIPSNIKSIGYGAFRLCSNLNKLNLSTGIERISHIAFLGTSISSLEIPSSVISIGKSKDREQSNPFAHCPELKSIKVDIDNPKYDSRNNCNAIIESSSNKLITGCCNTIIPDNICCIEFAAFDHCSIETVILPKSISIINVTAFYDCKKLRKIVSYIDNPTKELVIYGADDSTTVLYVPKGSKKKYEEIPWFKNCGNIVEMEN